MPDRVLSSITINEIETSDGTRIEILKDGTPIASCDSHPDSWIQWDCPDDVDFDRDTHVGRRIAASDIWRLISRL